MKYLVQHIVLTFHFPCTVRPFVSQLVSGTPRVQKDYKNYNKKQERVR